MLNSVDVDVDVAIIGSGIIGLLIAKEILEQKKNLTVVLLEQEKRLGHHTSSRNSGVLHSGIYYQKDSLKHKMCIEGNELWSDLARCLQIPINRCGKYIISSSISENAILEKYYNNAVANGVKGVRLCDFGEISKLSSFVRVSEAFFSPNTGILDVSDALSKLSYKILTLDGVLLLSNRVNRIEVNGKYQIFTNSETINAPVLINSAGLESVIVDEMLGVNDFQAYMVKGNYLKLKKPFYNQSLVYPIPEDCLKGLGVHTTFDFQGEVRFGPNTEDVECIDYSMSEDLELMKDEILKKFKGIKRESLAQDFCGIRPKIKKEGEIFSDFFIEKKENKAGTYIRLHGIESPGLTSAPAIGRHVVGLI